MVARVIGMALAIMGLVKMVDGSHSDCDGHVVVVIHGVACENSLFPQSFSSHSTLLLSVVLLSSVFHHLVLSQVQWSLLCQQRRVGRIVDQQRRRLEEQDRLIAHLSNRHYRPLSL